MPRPDAPSDESPPTGRIVVGAIVACVPPLLLAWWWAAAGEERLGWLGWMLYWVQPLVLAVAGGCLWWRLRDAGPGAVAAWFAEHRAGVALALLATAAVFVFVTPTMRVQFDETSLLGVSQNMHERRHAVMTTAAIPFDGAPFPLQSSVDKRPTLFAFLVSLVHDVSGYRIANAFVVNGALLALALLLVSVGARRRAGPRAGLAAPLLLLALPLTTVVATSAGFELLAVVLLVATTLAALAFLERPSDTRAAALLGCGLLFAYARYESLLALFVIAVLVVRLVWRRYRPSGRIWLLLAVVPTLLAPLWPLLQHAQNPNFTPEAGGEPLFALHHLTEHVGPLLLAAAPPSLDRALMGPLGAVGVLLWLAAVCWPGRRRRVGRVDVFVALPPLVLTVLMLLWFYGDVREITAVRLFLPLGWLLALAPLAATSLHRRAGTVLLAAAAVLAVVSVHGVATGRAFPELGIASLTRELDRAAERLPGDPATTLWVGAPAQHLIVKGRAAVSVRTFLQLGARIDQLRRQRDVETIYVLQTAIDDGMAEAFGSPRELLARRPAEVVERIGGTKPITVYRLAR